MSAPHIYRVDVPGTYRYSIATIEAASKSDYDALLVERDRYREALKLIATGGMYDYEMRRIARAAVAAGSLETDRNG